MSEFVQQELENTVDELSLLKQLNLVDADELKTLINRRQGFEYRIQKMHKEKTDFLEYIQFEVNLLELLRLRRRRLNIKTKRKELEGSVSHRIIRLFRMCTLRWQEDIQLWNSFIEFAKKQKHYHLVRKLYSRMAQVHGRNIDVWLLSAQYEVEQMRDMQMARNSIQRGLRFNNNSKRLLVELFRVEMLNWEFLLKRRAALLGIEPEGVLRSLHGGFASGVPARPASRTDAHGVPTSSPKKRRVRQETRTSESLATAESESAEAPEASAIDVSMECTESAPEAPASSSSCSRDPGPEEQHTEAAQRAAVSWVSSEPALEGRLARVVYQSIRQTYPDDGEILIQMIEICEKFSFASDLLEHLLDDLVRSFPSLPAAQSVFDRHHLEVLASADPAADPSSTSASVPGSSSGAHTNQQLFDSSSLGATEEAPAPEGSIAALKKYVAREIEEHEARASAPSLSTEANAPATGDEEREFQTRLTTAFEQLLLRAGSSDVSLWLQYARFLLRSSQSSAVIAAGSSGISGSSLTERYNSLYWRALKALDAPLVQDFVEQYTLLRLKQ